jgi:cytochrome c oxidase subunit 4
MSTHTETHTHNAGAHEEHGGTAVNVRTLIALLILTGLTVGAAYVNLGAGNVVVALFIATIKASLVVLFFMHLRWDKPVNAIIAMAGFLFLGIFMMFDLLDANSRNYYLPQNIHRTEVPLTPGTAPPALTEILPDTTGAAAAPAGDAAPAGEKASEKK